MSSASTSRKLAASLSVATAAFVVVPTAASSTTAASAAEITSIADIQGTSDTSPLVNKTVTTSGQVTAVYAEGGLRGYTVQTAGTGGENDPTPGISDGLFIYSPDTVGSVHIGDYVEVTGTISEYHGLTQMTVAQGKMRQVPTRIIPVQPYKGAFPDTSAGREELESMLLQPTGNITVTDNYNTNRYGEITLTNGTSPLTRAIASNIDDQRTHNESRDSRDCFLTTRVLWKILPATRRSNAMNS